MAESKSINNARRFLVEWSILNLLGWFIGLFLVIIIAFNLELIKHLAWQYGLANDFRKPWFGETMLVLFPLGMSIGILQWVKLRRIGINIFSWGFVTALGYGVLASLYFWVHDFYRFEYFEHNVHIPDWIISVSLSITLPVGGIIVGSFQSVIIRKNISTPGLWIRVYGFGLLLSSIIASLALLMKSFFLNILYSNYLYDLVDMRWPLFFGILIIVTALGTSIPTGKILLNNQK